MECHFGLLFLLRYHHRHEKIFLSQSGEVPVCYRTYRPNDKWTKIQYQIRYSHRDLKRAITGMFSLKNSPSHSAVLVSQTSASLLQKNLVIPICKEKIRQGSSHKSWICRCLELLEDAPACLPTFCAQTLMRMITPMIIILSILQMINRRRCRHGNAASVLIPVATFWVVVLRHAHLRQYPI
ncbi:hypothetical protein DFH27DRAFT_111920 [Peziza echinospora]|nr:hypothetical protein DFH27DRAFT_111920 [Peziza echinospora]